MVVFDNFLNEEDFNLFSEPSNWTESHPSEWMDVKKSPERFEEYLCNKLCSWYGIPDEAVGYEYWTNVLYPDKGLDWHVDPDEVLKSHTGEVRCPLYGCILYSNHENLSGGFLEIQHEDELERIRPVPNRAVFFDVSKLHRVAPVLTGKRNALSVNVWDYEVNCNLADLKQGYGQNAFDSTD